MTDEALNLSKNDVATVSVRRRELAGHAAMLTFSAIVGGSFSFGGLVANDIEPAVLNSVRFLIAALVLFVVIWISQPAPAKALKSALAAPWRYLITGGLIAFYMIMMFEALKTATPVSTAAVFTITPLLTAGFSYLVLQQVLPLRVFGALMVGVVGALWVVFRADLGAFLRFDVGRGEIIYFIGTSGHALYIPLLRKFDRGETGVTFVFYTLLCGSALMYIYGWSDFQQTNWLELSWVVWGTIFFLAVFGTAFSLSLIQFASMRLPGAKVMAYTYLIPSWVILIEIALGHGAPSIMILMGVLTTMIALLMLLRQD